MSNVVTLPTAASRKVRQPITRAASEARRALPQFPTEQVFNASPYMERCKEQAREMLKADEGAVMQLAMAVFSVLTEEQRIRVYGRLVGLSALRHAGAVEALAWVKYEQAPRDRKSDLMTAARLVEAEIEQ